MTTLPSLVNRFALAHRQTQPEGYFRSKLFITNVSSNPLLSAANPVFSLLERLGLSTTLPPIKHFRTGIEHELCAFQSRLSQKNYADELTIMAHYLLCATVDELMGKNYLRVTGQAVEFVAFTPISTEEKAPQRLFFDIVNHLKEKTHQYLDVIELAYYCLITGFEGENHALADGQQTLGNLIEELHQLINQHRVYKPHQAIHTPITPPHSTTVNRHSLWAAVFATIALVFALGLFSHMGLSQKAQAILQTHDATSVQ